MKQERETTAVGIRHTQKAIMLCPNWIHDEDGLRKCSRKGKKIQCPFPRCYILKQTRRA